MSWSLALGDRIGIELPFLEPPELVVSLEVQVDFPDADPMGVYVFPSLYYELYGPGIDSTPQLVAQNSTNGGIINIAIGATKVRVYLRYDAVPGPLGTLPHGDIRRSLLTLKAAAGFSVPTLGNRVHELILDHNATRIIMTEGTTLGVPLISGWTDLEPLNSGETFFYVGFNANYWAKFPLVEPPEHDIVIRNTSYINPAGTGVAALNNGSFTTNSYAGTHNFAPGTRRYFVQSADNVVSECTIAAGIYTNMGFRLVPAGTKAIFLHGVLSTSAHATFMENIATQPVGNTYMQLQMRAANNNPASRGKNWRLAEKTFLHLMFTGKPREDAPWFGDLTYWGD